MQKQINHLSNDSFQPSLIYKNLDKNAPISLKTTQMKESRFMSYQIQSYTQQRFSAIKKKYRNKQNLITEPYQSRALREISLRSSNYSLFKNSDQKSRSAVSKSILIYPSTLRQEARIENAKKSDMSKSIVRRIDESKYVSKFGGNISRCDLKASKSKEISSNKNQEERVGSIDKINMKIHQILNVLDDNKPQKQSSKSKLSWQLENLKVIKPEPLQENSKVYSAQSKIFAKVNDKDLSKHYIPLNERSSRTIDLIQESKTRRYSMNSTLLENAKMRVSYFPTDYKKDKSFFTGRNIDDQINKIQQKIKKSNDEKKRLDIRFPEKQNIELPKRLATYSKVPQRGTTMLERRNKQYSNISTFRMKTEAIQNPTLTACKLTERLSTQQTQANIEACMIKVRSKKNISSNETQTSKVQSKKLIDVLKKQVELDERLRNAKTVLNQSNITNKWGLIKEALFNQNINYSDEQIQRQFQITLSESNPFFSVKLNNQPIQDIVKIYLESCRNWNECVIKRFDYEALKREGFSEQKIDLEKKGYISIEDIVRYLNFQTSNFYRNRDIVLLFKRISNNTSMKFSQLMGAFCKV